MLFNRSDQFAAFTQWVTSMVAVLAIYGLCRSLNQSKPLSIFIALLYVTIPAVVLELSTAQSDLVVTSLFICCVYLLWSGWKENNSSLLLLSTLALGLGLGTKQTIFFALPGLALFLLLLFWKIPENKWKKSITWITGAVFFFILTGSYIYIQNWIFFQNPLGPSTVSDAYTRLQGYTPISQAGMGLSNLGAFLLMNFFSDFSGYFLDSIPVLKQVFAIKSSILNHSEATIGPLITYLSILGIVSGIRKRKSGETYIPIGFIVISIINLLVICFIRRYSTSNFRYSLISFAILLPLIGESNLFISDATSKKINNSSIMVISIMTIFLSGWVLTADGAKSLYGKVALPGMDRTFKQTILMGDFNSSFEKIDKLVPTDASIGIVGADKYPISPLFGKLLYPPSRADHTHRR